MSHLRLVKPAGPKPPKRRHHMGPTFSPEEDARIRAALRNARALFGSWRLLAAALRVAAKTPPDTASGRVAVSGDIAVRLARALGKPLESLYAAPSDATRCPSCGRGAP